MFEIEHHSNLAEITGRPGLSWSVCKTLYINHIKDIADEQISNAGRKLAALEKVLTWRWRWRHSDVYLPLQVAVGHASISPIMPVTFPGLPNHHQQHSPPPKHHPVRPGCSWTHTRDFGLVGNYHDFPQFTQQYILQISTNSKNVWHRADCLGHAAGLASSAPSAGTPNSMDMGG